MLTATINQWLPLFTRPATVNIVLDSWRFLQRESGFQLYGYVILENHLHLIAASPDLRGDMQRFKAYTAKQIIAYLQQCNSVRVLELLALLKRPYKTESDYQVWEEGSHLQLIESEAVRQNWTTFTGTQSSVVMWICRSIGDIPVRECCVVGGFD